jgi:hypothetical protein
MEKNNHREFLNVVGGQDFSLPEHIERATSDPEVIEAFNAAFPEAGIHHEPWEVFVKLLESKYGIGIISDKAERQYIIDLLRQRRIDNGLKELMHGKA